MKRYENTIVEKGKSVAEMGTEMMITFGSNAPDTLKDYCYIVEIKPFEGTLKAGQTLKLDNESFKIITVGDIAQRNLESLGHITVNFTGGSEDVLPGSIVVENKPCPEIGVGSLIVIED